MDITLFPRKLSGRITAIPSKSQAHRLLICAAFADKTTQIACSQTNQDIEATAACLRALGADIQRSAGGYTVTPVETAPSRAVLPCRESGSTLRFMLPIVGALGVDATFQLEGRLPHRPLSPLWEEMKRMGCCLSRPTNSTIACSGKLKNGTYRIDGNISSQFITGLLFAMTLIDGDCTLNISGKLESKPYVEMTLQALRLFGVKADDFHIGAGLHLYSPGALCVEGDWSNAAFFLTASRMGNPVSVDGLRTDSAQGDRAIVEILKTIDENPIIDATDIPDLIPILAIAAATFDGATFTNVARLRLKESDRVATVAQMLSCLGAQTDITANTLQVSTAPFHACTIDAHADHRIAMSAAIAATIASGPITILGAECVNKSYPSFWSDYQSLGGYYEQYVR